MTNDPTQKAPFEGSAQIVTPSIKVAPPVHPALRKKPEMTETPMEVAVREASKSEASWRKYYESLSDEGKRQVWHDYYERIHTTESEGHKNVIVSQMNALNKKFFSLKNQLRSMAFGLLCGGLVVLAFSFTLFNEMVIAPFIRPGQATTLSPVVEQSGALADPSPKIRIPKINVEIPLVYNLTSTDAKQFELALDQGVVHYPTTVMPGQPGNTAFFGHSSNNIFNPGKYKFAFVLLHELVPGDTFSITNNGQLYTYEVISRQVVKPSQTSVLGPVAGQQATATLITCDPPGTSNNRLVVVGRQISPNLDGTQPPVAAIPEPAEPASVSNLPGNGPGLMNRLWRSVFGE